MIRLFTRRRAAPPRPGPGPVATTDRVGPPRPYLSPALHAAAAQASQHLATEVTSRLDIPSSPFRPTLTTQSDDSEPAYLEPTDVLTAVVRHGDSIALVPGRYEVTYSRLGHHGRAGTPPPAPLTTDADSVDELAEAITHDAGQYLDDAHPEVITDLAVMGGHIRAGGRTVGSFTLRLIEPEQEGTTTP